MILLQKKFLIYLKAFEQIVSSKSSLSLLAAIIFFFNTGAYSQNAQRTVSGQVTDVSTGEILIGATVKVQGADNSATVDHAGKFVIIVPGGKSVLVVTFTGYTEQKIP
jgi:uncharacterized lipoprotein YajG